MVRRGSHRSTGASESQEKAEEGAGGRGAWWGTDRRLWKPGPQRDMCKFSEMEGGDGSSLTFAQILLELLSQATPEILTFHATTPSLSVWG